MTSKEMTDLMESSSEEILNILTSMKGLLLLSEHYANPPETDDYLGMLSKCISKLETTIHENRKKIY
ncbi:MAG: hypothetical protein ABIS36_05345 [Chryseolinea sp.]